MEMRSYFSINVFFLPIVLVSMHLPKDFKKCLYPFESFVFHASPLATSLGIPFSMQAHMPRLWAFHLIFHGLYLLAPFSPGKALV
jgi:hypothetical protein